MDPTDLKEMYSRAIWRAWRRAWISPRPLLMLTMMFCWGIFFTPTSDEALLLWVLFAGVLTVLMIAYKSLLRRAFENYFFREVSRARDRHRQYVSDMIEEAKKDE